MNISRLTELPNGWRIFDLNVGGFSIRGCRWNEDRGQILFPRRYSRGGGRFRVIWASGRQVLRLRNLLESGQAAAPRDRRPCTFNIRFRGQSRREQGWWVFDFTVRGFAILGCRWHPEWRSIQLPVTFGLDHNGRETRRMVVRAYGAHIRRLRAALEARASALEGEPKPAPNQVEDAVAV